ncbi:MAG: hypothetical protein Q9181_005816 [Wetmoreana brouardii]
MPLPTRKKLHLEGEDEVFGQWVNDLNSDIDVILRSLRIRICRSPIPSVQRRHKNGQSRRVLAILTCGTDITQWLVAAQKIFDLFLQSDGQLKVQVDMYNPERTYYRPRRSAPSEAQVFFDKVYQRLISAAQDWLRPNLLDVGVYAYVDEVGQLKPAVVMYVTEDSQCDWEQAIAAIRQILSGEMDMLLQPAKITPLTSRTMAERSGQPMSGDSICTENDPESYQTVGIFIKVEKSGDSKNIPGLSTGDNPCAITCQHGVAPVHNDQEWVAVWEKGIPLGGTDPRMHQTILHPSRHHLRTRIKSLSEEAETARSMIESLEVAAEIEEIKIKIAPLQKRAGDLEKQVAELHQTIERGASAIGKVLVSSGIFACRTRACRSATDGERGVSGDCPSNHQLRDIAVIRL